MRYLLLPLLFISALACAELPETDWLELMPAEDRQALEDMPEISHQGLEQDSGFYNPGGLKQQDQNLPAVMYSTKTVAAFDGKAVRLGGYPVPLETDSKGSSTLFFLVPYPGALLWSTKSGHWFRFIRSLIRHPLAFYIRCSCVAADGCSNPSDSAARPPQPGLGWHSRVPASTPFSCF